MRIYSFPPIARLDARILILGSMPGEASLKKNQYYAYKHNQFWRIMGELIGAGPDVAYEQRAEILKDKNIALWDVLQSCVRKGSLDSDIEHEKPNDFGSFFAEHSAITHVFFNGKKAEASFHRYCGDFKGPFILQGLPSTSPAHAGMNFDQKRQAWSRVLMV